jgi:hypothetical protein
MNLILKEMHIMKHFNITGYRTKTQKLNDFGNWYSIVKYPSSKWTICISIITRKRHDLNYMGFVLHRQGT